MLTVGVEEELQIVDAESGALVPRADAVLEHVRGGARDHIQSELNRCQIELDTPVCRQLDEVEQALGDLRTALAGAAAEVGCRVAATASHPFSTWRAQVPRTEDERYGRMVERFRRVASEQIICGAHVHVGLQGDVLFTVMRQIRPWLPVLLALSANSPMWDGGDSGYASYRTEVWQRWPTAGFPPALVDQAAFEAAVADLVTAGFIDDATHLYWYVRPSLHEPTLECRVFDVPLRMADTVALAGLYRALAWTLAEHPDAYRPRPASRELLDAALWQAARYGLDGDLVDPVTCLPAPAAEVVARVLDAAGPGLDHHGDRERVTRGVERILAEGTGATLQRRWATELEPTELLARILSAGGTSV